VRPLTAAPAHFRKASGVAFATLFIKGACPSKCVLAARKPESEGRACLLIRGDRNISYDQFCDVKAQSKMRRLLRRILEILAAHPGLKK